MNRKLLVVIIILVALVLIYLAYSKYISKQQSKIQADSIASQTALLAQQTASQEACKKNWLCSLTAVTDGIGGVIGSALN